jgi:hypothetical protein
MASTSAQTQTVNPADILTPLELAARLKVTKWWVYHQMRPTVRAQGSPLPAVKIGGHLRFHWPDVAAWLLAQQPAQRQPKQRQYRRRAHKGA